MSTRCTVLYDVGAGYHIYQECNDDCIHIEIERPGIVVDVVLMAVAQWRALGFPVTNTRIIPEREREKALEEMSNA